MTIYFRNSPKKGTKKLGFLPGFSEKPGKSRVVKGSIVISMEKLGQKRGYIGANNKAGPFLRFKRFF